MKDIPSERLSANWVIAVLAAPHSTTALMAMVTVREWWQA
jgi:hypothetical protein